MNESNSKETYVFPVAKCALIVKQNGIEFNQVLQNDACRLQQLQCHTSTHGHPFNRFFWGMFESIMFHFIVKRVYACV